MRGVLKGHDAKLPSMLLAVIFLCNTSAKGYLIGMAGDVGGATGVNPTDTVRIALSFP